MSENSRKAAMAAKKRAQQGRQTREGPLPFPVAGGPVPHTLTSSQIIVLATYVLGGERQPIDTEDLAVKANELAPGRFSWRKYPDQINLELVRVYASDAKHEAQGALMRGSGNEGWMLKQGGAAWAETHLDCLAGLRQARVRNRKADRVLKAERTRLRASEAFLKPRQKKIIIADNGRGMDWFGAHKGGAQRGHPTIPTSISVENLLAGKRSGESAASFKRWLQQRALPK